MKQADKKSELKNCLYCGKDYVPDDELDPQFCSSVCYEQYNEEVARNQNESR